MNKAMHRLLVTVWVVCAVTMNAYAAEENAVSVEEEAPNNNQPTMFFGEAQTPNGGINEAIVEQNNMADNPMGNPIVGGNNSGSVPPEILLTPEEATKSKPDVQNNIPSRQEIAPVVQSTDQGIWKPGEVPLPQPSNKIENELYQSGNDIIDVQAYPIKDVSTVTEPNLQPAIITQ